MAESGFTRASADWNTGLNLTRLLTLRTKAVINEIIMKMNNKVPFVNERLNSLPKKIEVRNRPKDKKEISLQEIKLQNRAGKGSSIMTIVLDDEIKDIV